MGSTWNFNSTLTRNHGSFGASLLIYMDWKIPKIADFPPSATCSMTKTSTSERRVLAPDELGTSRKLPQVVNGPGGWSCASMSTDLQDF